VSTATPSPHAEPAIVVARDREDVLVGDEIVRHRRSVRLVHWTVAVTFMASLLSGMPIWTPIFGWMAFLFGGLAACRVVHPWTGIAFSIASVVMFFQWVGRMHIEPSERAWFGKRLLQYMRYQGDDSATGKYNGGQKILFWAVSLGMIGLLVSGAVMWFPASFPPFLRRSSYLLHDFTFILFAVAIVFHVYLGTAAEPGTFRSMTRGTVTREWARFHHPRWYRDVTGDEP
jgi:formate dehydrogenase subunit gamma